MALLRLLLVSGFLGVGPLVAAGEFAALLEDLEQVGWSGSVRLEPLARELESRAAEAVGPEERIRVALALTPWIQREKGYTEARARLIELLGLAVDGEDGEALLARLRLGIAELARVEGKWGYAFRQLIEARRSALEEPQSAVLVESVFAAVELSLAAGMPQVGELILSHEAPRLASISLEERYHQHLLEARIRFQGGDYVAMAVELEALLAAMGTEMPVEVHLEYFHLRAWSSMAVGSLTAARQFMDAARARARLLDAPVLVAQLEFAEAALRAVSGESPERVEEALRNSARVFAAEQQQGVFLALYQRVMRFPGVEKLALQAVPFMQVLAEVPGRGLEPASQAMRLQALAELWDAGEAVPAGASSVAAYRESSWMRNEFQQGFISLAREWVELSPLAGGSRQAESGETFYIWVLLLSLVIIVLILLLRFRAQRHLNKELEKLVEKAFEAEQAAEASNRLKSQFLANVSHEIRAPLSGLVGMASILDEVISDPSARHYVETIRACSENLSVLMNDLIDLSRIDAGRVEIEVKPFNLRHLLEHNLELVRESAHIKGLQLDWSYRRENIPSRLLGDRVRIGQILSNLLQNAIKFTPRGRVLVEVDYERGADGTGELTLQVTDTGIGIAPERQRMVFEPFSKGPENEGLDTAGSGLGLAICQRLTSLMGGSIDLESTPGEGSTFRLRLPLKETDFDA